MHDLSFRAWRTQLGLTIHRAAIEIGDPESFIRELDTGTVELDRKTLLAMEALTARHERGELVIHAPGSAANARPKGKPGDEGIEPLAGDSWATRTARLALAILATDPRIRSYGELHDDVVAAGGDPDIGTMQKYAYPLGRIGQAIGLISEEMGKPVPPIEALVVNAKSQLPGKGIDGFLRDFLKAENKAEDARLLQYATHRPRIIKSIHADIAAFPEWDEVLRLAGVRAL
ncbi:hypothetical protein FBZ83_1299 [Azospirillum brasilense]|uniref:Uncharacterized protein n=1 Tax=Azospirillum brasilense TaxID=192 RepID=A0A560BM71_AZOBR|nr:hypothetical protein [Azospirillum brasilense]TWA73717.1 hypothetical protein FBZ83_1299 [Azospirillum brasilense]